MTTSRLPTRESCIAAAGQALAAAEQRLLTTDPHEAALAAHQPGGPSVADLEARIRAYQQEAREGPTDTSPPTG